MLSDDVPEYTEHTAELLGSERESCSHIAWNQIYNVQYPESKRIVIQDNHNLPLFSFYKFKLIEEIPLLHVGDDSSLAYSFQKSTG